MGGTEQPAPRCLWCGAALSTGARAGERRLRCAECGADTTWPAPGPAELDRAYAGWYRPEGGRFSGPGDMLLRRSRGRLAGRVDELAPPGPVLDVGSGDGALLRALEARGREAVGTERPEEDGTDAALAATRGRWSAIVFWHSLEHLPNPGDEVAQLPAALAPDGVVIVSLPNSDSLQARIFGDRWLHLDLPRHLVHVPAGALLDGIRRAGLRVERVSHARGGQIVFGWLHGLVGSLPGHPDLYDAIRRPEARSRPMDPAKRAGALLAGAALLPAAIVMSALEVALRRGGTVYVEARHV